MLRGERISLILSTIIILLSGCSNEVTIEKVNTKYPRLPINEVIKNIEIDDDIKDFMKLYIYILPEYNISYICDDAKDKLASVLTQLSKEQAFELIGKLTKETPIVGNLLTVGEITLNLTLDQIKLVEEYKTIKGECDQLNAQISTLTTLIEANINQKGSVVVIVNENYNEKNPTNVDYTNISVTVAGVNGGEK